MCCIPLLPRWFISHLPRSIMKNEQGLRWSQIIMSLSHTDIYWYSRSYEDITIIDHCGEFPNVPLLGIREGITYKPSLSLCQFGYARRDGPHDTLIQGIVFDYENDPQGYRQRFTHAWVTVSKIDSKALGYKNSIPMEPYLRCVRARAQNLMMPYITILPVIVEPVT